MLSIFIGFVLLEIIGEVYSFRVLQSGESVPTDVYFRPYDKVEVLKISNKISSEFVQIRALPGLMAIRRCYKEKE